MIFLRTCFAIVLAALLSARAAVAAEPAARMVQVEANVSLEVLDFGGAGAPLVFLAGYGQTAHTFEGFAERFTDAHHVYAITRRGFGVSSHPAPTDETYAVARLAADVIAVNDKLGLVRPVLAGHSVAGQELTEVGQRHPDKISGLIYLDAANAQAFYGPRSDVLYPIAGEVRADLTRLISAQPSEARRLIAKLRAELPRLERGLDWFEAAIDPSENASARALVDAVVRGARVRGPVNAAILSIVADPPVCEPNCGTPASQTFARETAAQTDDFAAAHPSAVVVRLPYADHFVWKSNPGEVEASMRAFLKTLPNPVKP